MIPFRLQVKFFLTNSDKLQLAEFAGIFQRWIQQNTLQELIIDVADYRHVFEGPGIILIGHESDYAIESRDSRVGLLYTRKRQTDANLRDQLRTVFRLALNACELLESETVFQPRLKFHADHAEIRFLDRLQIPNRPETFDLVKTDLQVILNEVFGSDVHFASAQRDPRHVFTVNVQSEGKISVSDLLHQFQPSAEG
jgi:hypothetical protein